MGSATREAIAVGQAALADRAESATLAVGQDLFSAARVIGDSAQLLTALVDTAAEPAAKAGLLSSLFGSIDPNARDLLESLISSRWSEPSDLLAGIEDIGIRVLALSADPSVDIPAELFAFGGAVSSDAELELAVGRKLADPSAKVELVNALLKGKASDQAVAIVGHLVRQPRGRRIGALLRHAAGIVADQDSQAIATVTVATPMGPGQLERLRAGLTARYGAVRIHQVVDAGLVGGMRIAIGDVVIDDSVAARVRELKLQLAG